MGIHGAAAAAATRAGRKIKHGQGAG